MIAAVLQFNLCNAVVWLAADAGHGGGAFDPYWASVWTLVVFLLLVALLGKFAWPKILHALEEREEKIRQSLELAEKARAEAQQVFDEHKRLVAEARAESLDIVNKARAAGEAAKNQILEDARKEADHLKDRALKEIELATDKARSELRIEAVNLSLQVAGKVLHKTLDQDSHKHLARECIDEVIRLGNR